MLSYPTLPSSNVEGHQVQGNLVTKSPHDPPLLPTPETHPPTINRLTKPTNKQQSLSPGLIDHHIKYVGQSIDSGQPAATTHRQSEDLHSTAHPNPNTGYPIQQPLSNHYPVDHYKGHPIVANASPTSHHVHLPTSHPILHTGPPAGHYVQPSTSHQVVASNILPSNHQLQVNDHSSGSQLIHPSGQLASYPIGQSGHPIGQIIQPSGQIVGIN